MYRLDVHPGLLAEITLLRNNPEYLWVLAAVVVVAATVGRLMRGRTSEAEDDDMVEPMQQLEQMKSELEAVWATQCEAEADARRALKQIAAHLERTDFENAETNAETH